MNSRPKHEVAAAAPVPRYAPRRLESAQVQRTRARIQDAARHVFGQKGSAASIIDIVAAAGISRPSFYNYYASMDALFESVTGQMVSDMNQRIDRSFGAIEDPAARISIGVRHYCKRAHEDPDWANFLLRFALLDPVITDQARETLLRDIQTGIGSGRFSVRPDEALGAFGMIVGGVLAAMMVVRRGIEGHVRIGEQTALSSLRVLGVKTAEARALSRIELTELRDR